MSHISFLQLWNASKSHGIDVPIQVVTLALYVELQLGDLPHQIIQYPLTKTGYVFSLQGGRKSLATSSSSIARSIDESQIRKIWQETIQLGKT